METFTRGFPHSFYHGEYGVGNYPKTVDELDIINLSMGIREKPNWMEKMNNPEIVAKWKEEVSDRIQQSQAKLDYVLAELEYYKSLKDGPIEIAAVDGTWQSDNLIDDNLRQQLISEASVLENVPVPAKDWHPGSDGLVLNLVHPSLYCFISGNTRIIKENATSSNNPPDGAPRLLNFVSGDNLLSPEESSKTAFNHTTGFPHFCKSTKFQWLPAEFKVNENGSVSITSYINNLHPDIYANFYSCLENIFAKFIPLFNKVLTDLRNPRPNRLTVTDWCWYENPPESNSDEEESDEPVDRGDPKPLDIPVFPKPGPPSTTVDLLGRNLQVIVKLANIELTPSNPEYPGGSWHVEGMVNERIVASGIYYYSSENITESRLLFRHVVQEPDYEQYDDRGVLTVYGLKNEHALNQNLGSIITKQGRCIAFPNTLQHFVAPFELEDKTHPGHRKILVFFLVDPTVNVISTARVPPQQKSWLFEEIVSEPVSLPKEIVEKIVSKLDGPMDLREAKKQRKDLMKERKYFVRNCNEQLFERPFYLCEH